MKILALESATTACSAAAWCDGAILAVERTAAPRGQAEILLPLVERVRRASGFSFGEIDRFAVTVGPGHFTGLRAGLAAARGLALATGRPLVGITTLSAVAAGVSSAERRGAVVLVALDSKRPQPYVQAFDAELRPLEPPSAPDAESYAGTWPTAGRAPRVVAVGDAAAKLEVALAAIGVAVTRSTAPPGPDAALVAALAAMAPVPDAPPAPLYIHRAETTTSKQMSGRRS